MPKKYSLKLKKQFQRLFRSGIRKNSENFSIVFVDSEELKFAFIVDAKTMPRAVDRTYSKRIMREVVRNNFLQNCKKPMHIAIRPLKNLRLLVKEKGFDNIQTELTSLLGTIDFSRPAIRSNYKNK